jgi:Ca2+-binding EF-hand superfamily protein
MSSIAPPGRVRVQIAVPAGMVPGRQLRVQHGDRQYDVAIPAGVPAGGTFLMEVPALPPTAAPVAEPVPMGLPVEMERPPASVEQQRVLRRSESTGRAIIAAEPRAQAEMKAECPICFEPLSSAPVGVFLGPNGRRVSQHFFNLEAAREWMRTAPSQHCPLTRKPISRVLEVPDIRSDPDGWFEAVDIDGDGRLSRMEVVECLKEQLPIDNAALDAALADAGHWMWQQWDTDGNGYIERQELLSPEGLCAYVRSAYARVREEEAIPDINQDKEAWYRYWDVDESGTLDKEETVRALLKTFRMTSDMAAVSQMRSTLDAIWPIFDDDGSGTIERAEFLRGGEGLADTIIATLGLDRR